MKVRQIMTQGIIPIEPEETAAVAARTLTHYNIGALPVCKGDKLCGLLTDRDLVTRCLAAGRDPQTTKVKDIMTSRVITACPDMEVGVAAHLMGRQQIRRLPVVEGGKLQGMVSLGDLALQEDSFMDAADALADLSSNVTGG